MPIAYPLTNQLSQVFLSKEELSSLNYHNIFEFPLTTAELIRWSAGPKALTIHHPPRSGKLRLSAISQTNGFFHLTANPGAVLKRLMRKRISARKVEIAKKAARVISFVPTVQMVAITGALAMENASDESDIDLMIIARKGTLWTTRAFVYSLIRLFGIKFRRPGDAAQRDKLCLNIWLDESNVAWPSQKRNIYTAHEIAQITPLVNKGQSYEKFIAENEWIKKYWPNAARVGNKVSGIKDNGKKTIIPNSFFLIRLFERIAFWLQYQYMKSKITNETVTKTRALFHPVDWSEYVLKKLST